MAELAINRQNRQTVKQKYKWDGKEALWNVAILAEMAYLAKVAEMAINRQNCQIVGLITGSPNAVLATRAGGGGGYFHIWAI